MTDVLTAIDDALDTGLAAHEDPSTRELQELALELKAGRRVEAGFPKAKRSKRASWRRFTSPAFATGLILLPIILLAVVIGGSGTSNDDSGGGGRSSVAESGGGGVGSAKPDGAAASGGAESAPGSAEPFVGSRSGADHALTGGGSTDVLPLEPPSGRGFAPGRSDRRIERSVALELETPVDEMARVADQVTAVTNRHGGFVLSSSVSTGDSAGGDFDLRIPAARLRPALRDLAALADVRTQSQTGRDVTREHVTARDRLRAARGERRSLLRRLELATTDEQAEAIRRRLDIVAGEINGLRARLHSLRLRTDYAVVTVSLIAKDGNSGGGAGGGSFDDALGDAGDILVTVAGVLVRALAVALPLGLVALVGWLATGALRRRRRESALA
jgi:Domain of unknown function (DUF4349)